MFIAQNEVKSELKFILGIQQNCSNAKLNSNTQILNAC